MDTPNGTPASTELAPDGRTPRGLPPDGLALDVRGVSKCYQVYARPSDRLKQAFFRWRRRYDREFWAVRDVSFGVRRGESVGIIGRNGSGKSTLLQVIAGVLTPSTGEVVVRGRVSALLELGAGFNTDFTGRENVFLSGAIYGLPRAEVEALFQKIADFADIGEFIDRPVKTYSSGMFVRLAFAVAAQIRPDILVVDEALAVGDIFFQQKCMRFMKEELAGATRVLVTHDRAAVASLCDRCLVMHRGELVFDGPPLEAIEFYTKLAHTEEFGRQKGGGESPPGPSQAADWPAGAARAGRGAVGPRVGGNPIPWTEVSPDSRGGRGEVVIERVAVTDRFSGPLDAVQPGQRYTCHVQLRSGRPARSIIVGVMVVDRFGNNVCGDSSASPPGTLVDLPAAGLYEARLEYEWPELAPGTYTMTMGVGEGTDPLAHTIQCWAHNVVAVSAISPRKVVHGIFNNPLRAFEFGAVSGEAGAEECAPPRPADAAGAA